MKEKSAETPSQFDFIFASTDAPRFFPASIRNGKWDKAPHTGWSKYHGLTEHECTAWIDNGLIELSKDAFTDPQLKVIFAGKSRSECPDDVKVRAKHKPYLLTIPLSISISNVGIGVVDIDTDAKAVRASIIAKLGNPIAECETGRSTEERPRYHLLYPVERDGGYTANDIIQIDGKPIGDWRCGNGLAAIYDIDTWITAVDALKSGVKPISPAVIGIARKEATEHEPSTDAAKSEAERIAKALGLKKDDIGWRGACPLPDCTSSANDHRCFSVRDKGDTAVMKCWACAKEGLSKKQYAQVMEKVADPNDEISVELPKAENAPPRVAKGGSWRVDPPMPDEDETTPETPTDIFEVGASVDTLPGPNEKHHPVDWLLPNVIPMSAVTIISSTGGIGKSTLMSYICLSMLQEKDAEPINIIGDWQLDPRAHGSSSWFISYEDDDRRLARRFRTFLEVHRNKLTSKDGKFRRQYISPQYPIFESWHNIEKPDFTRIGESLIKYIENPFSKGNFPHGIPPRLIVIDPVASAFGGSENDRREVRQFVGRLDRLANENEIAIVLIAHPPKSGSSYSGSTDWVNAARSMFTIKPMPPQIHKAANGEVTYKLPEWAIDKFDFETTRRLITGYRSEANASASGVRQARIPQIIEVEKLNDGKAARPIAAYMTDWKYTDRDGNTQVGYGLRSVTDINDLAAYIVPPQPPIDGDDEFTES